MPKRGSAHLMQGAIEFELKDADSISEQFSRRFAPIKIEPISAEEQVGVRGIYGVAPGFEFNTMRFNGDFTMIPQAPFDSFSFFF